MLALLVDRVIDAQSKLATARALAPESTVSTLGQTLGLGDLDPHELYAAMDWLVPRQAAIEQRLAKRHFQEHTLVLYDLTSSYVEGTHCPLARRGHSRDRKKGTLQIVFGLLCTAEGCPVAVEVFEGSTADPKTVASQVTKIRERFGLQHVVLVGDRGMLTASRIREDLADVEGLRWITTLRAPTIRKLVDAGAVTPSFFDERDLAEITSEEFPGERLIVCRNSLLAAERQRKRHELLAATEKDLEPIAAATRRENKPLRGKADIGVRVGKVINRYKMAKHFLTDITDESFTFRRDEEKIGVFRRICGQNGGRVVPSSDPHRPRVLTGVKARRSAPPPLRGADGLDAGSAHARTGSCLTRTNAPRARIGRRRPRPEGQNGASTSETHPVPESATIGVAAAKRRGRRTGCTSRVS